MFIFLFKFPKFTTEKINSGLKLNWISYKTRTCIIKESMKDIIKRTHVLKIEQVFKYLNAKWYLFE